MLRNAELIAQKLSHNGVVVLPTETVYGLAGNAFSCQAVGRIFSVKGRPPHNPLIVHIQDHIQAEEFAVFSPTARKLAQNFWPGSLTLVLPLRSGTMISPLVTAGLPTIGLRCPNHGVFQKILRSINFPLAAPSANISQSVSPVTLQQARNELGNRADDYVEGGRCMYGLESTIVTLSEDDHAIILRPGAITQAQISAIVPVTKTPTSDVITAPGQMQRHYAPARPLILNAKTVTSEQGLIYFGDTPWKDKAAACFCLSEKTDLPQAARQIFTALHWVNTLPQSITSVAITPIPETDIGIAINDRLRRAAAKR